MKLCGFVFFCLLVPSQTVIGSCLNKTVEVLVLNGIGLSGDGYDDPEPYVVVKIGDESHKTIVIESSTNPVWWMNFKFNSVSSDDVKIEVWEEDGGLRGDDDHLGTCKEHLSQANISKIIKCPVKDGLVNFSYKCY